jgi:hypothetical protein
MSSSCSTPTIWISHAQRLVGIRKQRALEDTEKPESDAKEGTTTVSMVTVELGLNVAVIRASDDEQRTARRHIIRMILAMRRF